MSQYPFTIIQSKDELPNWGESLKFNKKYQIVDEKGQIVDDPITYKGRKFLLISKKERNYSNWERLKRGLLGTIALLFSFIIGKKKGLSLIKEKKAKIRYGVELNFSEEQLKVIQQNLRDLSRVPPHCSIEGDKTVTEFLFKIGVVLKSWYNPTEDPEILTKLKKTLSIRPEHVDLETLLEESLNEVLENTWYKQYKSTFKNEERFISLVQFIACTKDFNNKQPEALKISLDSITQQFLNLQRIYTNKETVFFDNIKEYKCILFKSSQSR